MSPADEALAFRIWQYANPIGWDCQMKDVAEHLGIHWQRVRSIALKKGWNERFRLSKQNNYFGMGAVNIEVWRETAAEVENMRSTLKVLGD